MYRQIDVNGPNHSVSRREFLRGIGAMIAVGVVAPLGMLGMTPRNAVSSPARWNHDTFAPLVGDNFTAQLGSKGKQTLKLIRIRPEVAKVQTRERKTVNAPAGSCFALVFQSALGVQAEQQTFEFEHPRLGNFSLFVVPGSMETAGQKYVAIVNHVPGENTTSQLKFI